MIKMENASCIKVNKEYKVFEIKNMEGVKTLEELVVKNLPQELEDYDDFIADISICINIKPPQLNIVKTGYEEDSSNEKHCGEAIE
jgi:hypothetical protein